MDLSIPFMLARPKQEDGNTTKPTLKWINMYGSRTGNDNSAGEEMNKDPKIASSWKGRILIEYFVEESEFPLSKIIQIND